MPLVGRVPVVEKKRVHHYGYRITARGLRDCEDDAYTWLGVVILLYVHVN